MSLRELRRHVGRLAIVGFTGHSVPAELRRLVAEFDLGGVIYFARNVVEPAQVRGAVARGRRTRARLAALDQRRSGRRTRGAAEAPFTEWPPAITLGRSGDEQLAARFAARAGRRAARRRHQPRLRAGARRPHESGEPGHRRSRAGRAGRRLSATLGARVIRGAAGARRRGLRQALSRARRHERRLARGAADRRARPRRLEAVELVPFRAAIADGVATIMTAHVLVPALDARSPGLVLAAHRHRSAEADARLWRRGDQRRPGHEGRQRRPRRCRRRRWRRFTAGCDAVLLCNSTDRRAGGGARSHHSRGRVRRAPAARASTTRCARQQRVKARFSPRRPRPRPCARRRRLRRASGASPRRWPRGDDAAHASPACVKFRPLRPGQPRRARRAGQPVRARGVRRRRRRAARGWASSRCSTTRVFDARGVRRRARRDARARRCCARGRARGRRRDRGRARRLRQRRGAAAARRGCDPRVAHGVHRLQRRHVASHVSRRPCRPGVACTDR